MASGASYTGANGETKTESQTLNMDLSGLGISLALELEARLARGLYFGGIAMGTIAKNPSVALGSLEGELDGAKLHTVSFGPGVRYYLEGDRGLHFQGFAGIMFMRLTVGEGRDMLYSERATGPTAGAAIGYDFSASKSASVGVSLGAQWANVSHRNDTVEERFTVFAPALTGVLAYGLVSKR